MQIVEVDINKIKFDPDQPRQTINQDKIEEMAQSIKTAGVINPIEIDENFVIITGEMRYRSAKLSGLEKIPCKIMSIEGDERFMRQVIENVHHNTMTDWDTSKAIEKLLSLSPGDSKLIKTGSGGHNDRGETWLSEKIGKSRGYIIEHLELLESSEAFQKAVKEDRINFTLNRAIKQTPDEFKVAMEEKILNNEFASRDGAIALAKALKDNPNHSRQLLKTNYSDCKNSDQIKEKIRKTIPDFTETPISDAMKKGSELPTEFGNLSLRLLKLMNNHPLESVGKIHTKRILMTLNILDEEIQHWLNSEDIKIPEII